jgi:hypothetical protein
MNRHPALTERLADLQSWRYGLAREIERLGEFLRLHDFLTPASRQTLTSLSNRLARERLTIAFIAEVSRGKSELINALFFADQGRRLLPSGTGKTTCCVTELRFDRDTKTGVKLLPIETRESPKSFQELSRDDSAWRFIPFDADNPDSIARALAALSETKRITLTDAVSWGLHGGGATATTTGGLPMVDVPRWRHAVVNIPHPLLDAGLVIIDTPGLAALSAEPELARERIPGADAMVLVLDIVEGVTKPDFAIWKDYLGGARGPRERGKETSPQARLVILNKIDTLRSPATHTGQEADRAVLREIDRRVQETADLLRTDPITVVPVSAQLGLQGRLGADKDKWMRSRLYQFERVLADRLPRHRGDALTREILTTLSDLIESAQASLDQERYQTLDGLKTLVEVRAKNEKLTESLAAQTVERQKKVELAVKELKAVKSLHVRLETELSAIVDASVAREEMRRASQKIASSMLPGKMAEYIREYLRETRAKLEAAEAKIEEVRLMYGNVGEKMRRELGLGHFEVHPFATQRFRTELQRAEQKAEEEVLRGSGLLVRRGQAVSEEFEEKVASRVVHVFEIASRESHSWMRGLYLALERPLEEMASQLEARSAGLEKVNSARLDLAERIAELQAKVDVIKRRHTALADARAALERASAQSDATD